MLCIATRRIQRIQRLYWLIPVTHICLQVAFLMCVLDTCCSHFLTIIAGVDLHFRHDQIACMPDLGIKPGRWSASYRWDCWPLRTPTASVYISYINLFCYILCKFMWIFCIAQVKGVAQWLSWVNPASCLYCAQDKFLQRPISLSYLILWLVLLLSQTLLHPLHLDNPVKYISHNDYA